MLAVSECLRGCPRRFSGLRRLLDHPPPPPSRGVEHGIEKKRSGVCRLRIDPVRPGAFSFRASGEDRPAAVTLSQMEIEIRHARPSDYGRVYPLVNDWWGGREMTQNLPGVFFVHFEGSSFIANTPDCALAGFLCGFLSETNPDEAYVHMAGVAPELRRRGIGRRLYETFFEAARAHGRSRVSLITAPINTGSIAFHEALLSRGARVRARARTRELRRPR